MFWTVTLSILRGCGEAAKLFFLTLLFGLPLGLPIAFGSMSKWAPFRFLSYGQRPMGRFTRWLSEVKPIRALTNVIVWVIRGTFSATDVCLPVHWPLSSITPAISL